MSNDSTPSPPERPEPTLPQFDPRAAVPVDPTQVLPVTPTARTPIVPPATPYTYAGGPVGTSEAAPSAAAAGSPPPGRARRRWSGRKTAITAGVALVLTTAGALGAAAAIPAGSTAETGRFGGPGQGGPFPFPGGHGGPGQGRGQLGQQGQGQQGLPNQQPKQGGGQLPTLPGPGQDADGDSDSDGGLGTLGGLDADQLLQLSPDELLRLLQEQGELGSGQDGSGGNRSGQDSQGDTGQDGSVRTT